MLASAATLAALLSSTALAKDAPALLLLDGKTGPLRQPDQGDPSLKVDFDMRKQIWGDHDGNVYYSMRRKHVLYKIDAKGTVHVAAGNGHAGTSGDGGPARDASLRLPGPVWGDRSGQVFFLDNDTSCVRRIDTHGVITTAHIFEWQQPSISGLWGDTSGDLFVTDATFHQVRRLRGAGTTYIEEILAGKGPPTFASLRNNGDGGSARDATLVYPNGLWGDDSGNLYLAEMSGHRIRKIDKVGKITTIAGTGRRGFSGDGGPATSARLNCPCDVWGDGYGSLFVADMDNHRVRKIDPDGRIQTFAGKGSQGFSGDSGSALNASLSAPKGIWVDRHSAVFVSDTFNHRIRRVDERGTISSFGRLSTSIGNSSSSAHWSKGLRLAKTSGDGLLISDAFDHSILKVAGVATSRLAGNAVSPRAGGGESSEVSKLKHPEGICTMGDGKLYLMDSGSSSIIVVDGRTGHSQPLAIHSSVGEGPMLSRPVACAARGSRLLVVDKGSHQVLEVDVASGKTRRIAGNGQRGCDAGRMSCPYGVALGGDGSDEAFVTDPCCPDAFVRRVALKSGELTTLAGHSGVTPTDRTSAAYGGGFLWITSIDDCGLEVVDTSSGRMHQVEMLDLNGRTAGAECVLDIVSADEKDDGGTHLDLLSISKSGDIEVVHVRVPTISIIAPGPGDSWPAGDVRISWKGHDSALLGHGELSLVEASGSIRISLGRPSLADNFTVVLASELPAVATGVFYLELGSERWPFVQGRAGPFHFDGRTDSQASAPVQENATPFWPRALTVVVVAVLAGVLLAVGVPLVFLRVKLKDYGRMGGAVIFQRRAKFGGPDAERAQKAEEEMNPMSGIGDGTLGGVAVPVALGRTH